MPMRFPSLFHKRAIASRPGIPLHFHNTLGNDKQLFTLPAGVKAVRMYNCGPTVYGRQHIGNLSMFVFTDVLRRVLEYNDYEVRQVINFTDFGHLTSDADEGEDKMTKGLKREGMKPSLENMKALGQKYAKLFLEDIEALGIDTRRITFPYASEYIAAQIAMIQSLEEKGYAYRTNDGVYYDTSMFRDYGKLGDIDIEGLKEGARVALSDEKRNPTDFLLWKSDKKIGWESPWGRGFPGWHIECSAMIRATLGQQIDIHTGGIEHIPIHHNNEIAQSEAAIGKKPLSRFWLHRAHIQIEGGKIAKSKGAVIYLSDVVEKGFHPLSLRYLFLGAHYRTPMNFTWDALAAAEQAFSRLLATRLSSETIGEVSDSYRAKFIERVNDDLDTPGAIALTWDMLKDESLSDEDKVATLLDFDRVFGLGLVNPDDAARTLASRNMRSYVDEADLSADAIDILKRRETARADKNWVESDALRDELAILGFGVEDSPTGQRLYRKQ